MSVEGTFYADTLAPGELDITRPVHLKKNVNKGKSKLILFETIKLPSMTYMTLMMVLSKDPVELSNPFYCPGLFKIICKQFLSLFPLFCSCSLGDQ